MNIYHIVSFDETRSTGPGNSVPALARSQQQIIKGKVFVINLYNNYDLNHLKELFHFNDEEKNKNVIIIFHGIWNSKYWKIAKQIKVPYIIVPRGSLVKASFKKSWHKKIVGFAIGGIKFIKNSSALHFLNKDELKNSISLGKRTFIISNGGHYKNLKFQALSNSKKYVLFLGRLDIYHKGLDLLIKAASRCKSSLLAKGIKIMIIGDNYQNGGETLKHLINKLSCQDIVQVEPRRVTGDEKTKLISQALAFIHTSRYEGEPQAVMEALSYGIPCVVTHGANLTSLLQEWSVGIVCKSSPDEIASSLEQICDLSIQNKFRKNFTEDMFLARNWNKVASETIYSYSEVLN